MDSKMLMKLISSFLILLILATNDLAECRKRRHRARGGGHGGVERRVVVAQDGSGDFRTIDEAIDESQRRKRKAVPFNIHIKGGVYHEYLVIQRNMQNIRLSGDGKGITIITGKHGPPLSSSPTVAVLGDGFVARGITFENTAGLDKNQSAAIKVAAEEVAFYDCAFKSFQDTVYVHSGHQFFKNCEISGNVDFICGGAAAVFQDSTIILREPKVDTITIAASHRESEAEDGALVFQNCRIIASPQLEPDIGRKKIYLGRPWRPYARIVFIQNSFDVPVHPDGWMKWKTGLEEERKGIDFVEYNNRGEGARTNDRVRWQGVRIVNDPSEVEQYTVGRLLEGDTWLQRTGVPYQANI